MNFDLDEEQLGFSDHARTFFTAEAGAARARALLDEDAEIAPGHAMLAELGFLSVTIAESAGGVGSDLLNLALVAEQAGRHLAGPSLVTAARVAVLLEGDDQRLSAVSSGELRVAVIDGPIGAAQPAIDAVGATHFLTLEGDDLVIGEGRVDAGTSIDPTRGLGYVELISREVVRTDARATWERARQVACVVLAAEGLGAAGHVVDLGVEHAKNRTAFGRQIGGYQAVKHRLVDDWVAVDQLRSLVWWAAWVADHDPQQLPLAASTAKAYCATVFETACETLIHVLGGIGFTWEHDAHLYWRRAKVDRLLLGDESEHLAVVAEQSLARASSSREPVGSTSS